METGSKILFATDFSNSAQTALNLLLKLAENFDLDIYFTHVLTTFWNNVMTVGEYEKEVSDRLTGCQRKTMQQSNPSHIVVSKGHPAKSICHSADELEASMIMLGTGDKSKQAKLHTGTIACSVAKLARQPVWIAERETIKSIICGIDGSAGSAKALREAILLAHQFQAKLSVVSVVPLADFSSFNVQKTDLATVEEQYKNHYIKNINGFLQEFEYGNVKVEYHFPWGRAAQTLIGLANSLHADLIVIGAKGESRLDELSLGRVADKVLNYAPCSLLLMR
ncbi:MAG: universal stress protein [Gammaproteobacteria bacterium]|nr:universal stress protein [Gammaproteobacteria bacterium]